MYEVTHRSVGHIFLLTKMTESQIFEDRSKFLPFLYEFLINSKFVPHKTHNNLIRSIILWLFSICFFVIHSNALINFYFTLLCVLLISTWFVICSREKITNKMHKIATYRFHCNLLSSLKRSLCISTDGHLNNSFEKSHQRCTDNMNNVRNT